MYSLRYALPSVGYDDEFAVDQCLVRFFSDGLVDCEDSGMKLVRWSLADLATTCRGMLRM